jgi:hypothetical protein
MSNFVVGRPGQINQSGDVKAIFLKQFAGEVLTAYGTAIVTDGLHRECVIPSGKSA